MRFYYSRPERQGVSPHTIMRFLDLCEAQLDSLYSFAVVKGTTIAVEGYYEPMQPQHLKMTHSVSKSMNALAVGVAIGDGKLRLDDRMVDFFQDELPEQRDSRIDRITVRDLLMMAASSVATSAAFSNVEGSWRTFYFKSIPYDEPGEYFSYDTGAAYMLSCIVTKVMGQNSLAVLQERIFGPMGIEGTHWLEDKDGNNTGGWGFYVKAEDMLKIGRLILNYGAWEGRQLIPEWYMREATAKQIDTFRNPGTGWGYGYGYQFWRFPENTFGYFGAFGQLLVCSPEKDMYVVTTGGCSREENRRLLTIITETFFAESSDKPIPYDDEAYRVMETRLAKLKLPPALGEKLAQNEEKWFDRDYRGTGQEITELHFERKNGDTIGVSMKFREERISFLAGHGNWITGEGLPLDTPLHTIHSFSYGWVGENHLSIKQYMCNTTYCKVYDILFSQSGIEMTVTQNMAIGGERVKHYVFGSDEE